MKFALILAGLVWGTGSFADTLLLASTTSTQNSGLYEAILPQFEAETGIDVQVIAVGTGQAIDLAKRGDADILIVHHRPSEDTFVADGFGIDRRDLMYNDFVLIGPADDPAGLRDAADLDDALTRLADMKAPFISRGDESGTHRKEVALWGVIGREPAADYREIGAGMGAALNMAAAVNGYTLSDRGTWLAFQNKQDLELLFEGDAALFNPYGVIRVNPERHTHVNAEAALALSEWLTSTTGQKAIGAYTRDGQQLFCPLQNVDVATTTCPVNLE